SIEDPIEYQLAGVSQAQVNVKAGMTFAGGLRSMLRQDPDIIMVGELRDKETAEVAVHASLTGHLVLATIHANDSASTITRLFHMGVEPFLVSSSVICILAQRLVRKICPECKIDYVPPPESLQRLGIPPGTKLYRGQGCEFCRESGYMGRVGVFELLEIDDEMRLLISNEASAPEIRRKALDLGMYTLQQDGIRKVISGVTSIEEAMRVLFDTGTAIG
ncbi:MAG TPA: ATPase, T2SS/T4P/T4SS family, partial [bacterium]|nr:ATPase, T2SS/T4P/T4SS family [bacterium]